jgi:hypothetical protein
MDAKTGHFLGRIYLDQKDYSRIAKGLLVPYEKYCCRNGHKLTYCQFAAPQEQG